MLSGRALLATLATLALCAAPVALAAAPPARQYLDTRTAATILTMQRPLVFAHERLSLAVNARDYVSLVAVDVNRAGHHELYWYGHVWTTIDDDGRLAGSVDGSEWLLLADTRPIPLKPVEAAPRDLGIGEEPFPVPVRNARAVMFQATRESLEYLASAGRLALRHRDGTEYLLWRDTRDELQAFLEQAPR